MAWGFLEDSTLLFLSKDNICLFFFCNGHMGGKDDY